MSGLEGTGPEYFSSEFDKPAVRQSKTTVRRIMCLRRPLINRLPCLDCSRWNPIRFLVPTASLYKEAERNWMAANQAESNLEFSQTVRNTMWRTQVLRPTSGPLPGRLAG